MSGDATVLETARLRLRPWRETDAPALFRYASDPRVGPAAGWPAHKSEEESRQTILNVLAVPETYALTLRGGDEAVGAVSLMLENRDNEYWGPRDGEIGYWVGVPFWGRGYMPEAVCALLERAFTVFALENVWCGYYDGNDKSRRCQEKCGFTWHHTQPDMPVTHLPERRTEHFTRLTRAQWQARQARVM